MESALEEHLRASGPPEHVEVLGALHVPVEASEGHVAGGPYAEQGEPPPEELLVLPSGHVLLEAVVPSDLRAPPAVAVLPAVADGSRRYHVFVERLGAIAYGVRVQERPVRESDVLADALLEFYPVGLDEVGVVQHRPRRHRIALRGPHDSRLRPRHLHDLVGAGVLLERGALGRVDEVASDHLRLAAPPHRDHLLQEMEGGAVVNVQEPQASAGRAVLPVVLGASELTRVGVLEDLRPPHPGCGLPGPIQRSVDAFAGNYKDDLHVLECLAHEVFGDVSYEPLPVQDRDYDADLGTVFRWLRGCHRTLGICRPYFICSHGSWR